MGSFKDVVGHRDIINYIGNAVSMDQVSHAYILNGERGAGKKMLAHLFAMTVLEGRSGSVQRVPLLQAGGERQSSGYYPCHA